MIGAAVDRANRHDVGRAGGHGREQRRRDGRHSGGKGDRLIGPLHLCDGPFEAIDVRIPQSLVDEGPVCNRSTARREGLVRLTTALDAGQRVGARGVHARDVDAERGEVFAAGVHRGGCEVLNVICHT